MPHPSPIATVDVVLLTLKDSRLRVLLHPRDKEPFLGHDALPGGYIRVQEDEDAADAARRVLREKLGVEAPYLDQLATFSGKFRDPRGWSLSVAYFALVPEETLGGRPSAPVDELRSLPFDHAAIVAAAAERLRGRAGYSVLPCFLLPERFTLRQMQDVYEDVLGVGRNGIDAVVFRRKVIGTLVVPIEGETTPGGGRAGRPAQLYRVADERDRTLRSSLGT
jgi:8-oxo-dGTP diphosphatase